MQLSYDLHNHSTASDGALCPSQLVETAAAAGVRVLALTDHDTTDGIVEAGRAAQELGVILIPGVEISVTWSKMTIHVLGLNLDIGCEALQQGLAGLREFRIWRAVEIGERLERHGIKDALAGARSFSSGGLISRTHFARYLVQIGAASDERKVFSHFLVQGKPGHVAGKWANLEDAVAWIHAAGGQAVIAHPARYKMTRTKLRSLLRRFVELGGEGIEVISGSHNRDDARLMAAHARDFGLLASAGSDFHAPENAWIQHGRLPALPADCRPIWQDWVLPDKAYNAAGC